MRENDDAILALLTRIDERTERTELRLSEIDSTIHTFESLVAAEFASLRGQLNFIRARLDRLEKTPNGTGARSG